ncbi:MAG: DUF3644 domain-containing protein [Minisyncoccia bacterium]
MSKKISTELLDKSLEAMTMAIEIYNKPLVRYRTETSIILIINAWENVLKALIKKNDWAKLYIAKTNWYKPFDECLECVKANRSGLMDDAYQSIKLLYEKRCRVIHYHKSIEVLDYMAIQANILFFKDFVAKNFNRSILKDKTWYILPIGTDVPFTEFDFINYSSAVKNAPKDVLNYVRDVVSMQNALLDSNKKGILLSIKVNLSNVNRINDADIRVGIDNSKEESLSIEGILKISEQGKPVTISVEAFNKMKDMYPFTYDNVRIACWAKAKQKVNQQKFHEYLNRCKLDQSLSINWKNIVKSLGLPFSAPNKYMYKQKVIDDFK